MIITSKLQFTIYNLPVHKHKMTKVKESYKIKRSDKNSKKLGSEFGAIIENNSENYTKTGIWSKDKPLVDKNKCIACGICTKYCPEGAIEIKNVGGKKRAVIDYRYCKGCGICAEECPKKAIKF